MENSVRARWPVRSFILVMIQGGVPWVVNMHLFRYVVMTSMNMQEACGNHWLKY